MSGIACGASPPKYRGHSAPIVVALVNNTSEQALHATERQFQRVLERASVSRPIVLRFFTCPELPRSGPLRSACGSTYAALDDLFSSDVDALIVTGKEPQTAELSEEPIWRSLTRLVVWAQSRHVPTIWSCLAAHAAALYLRGIERVRLGQKLSGLFEFDMVSAGHPLMAGLPRRRISPHSRYYDLPENALTANDFRILSRSASAGVDMFAADDAGPFLFLQGHPEYASDTLLGEYRRDVRRFILGQSNEYPLTPIGYLPWQTEARLASLRRSALQGVQDPALLREVATLVAKAQGPPDWQDAAARIFANWLDGVTALDRATWTHPPDPIEDKYLPPQATCPPLAS